MTSSMADLIPPMIAGVPDGYFATQKTPQSAITFLRISRPARGNFKDCIKVQTQHGPDLELAWVLYPNGRVQVVKSSVIDALADLVCNWRDAAMRYAEKLGKCARCGCPLTDERSRHYKIGPECEKFWPWMIDEIDERHGWKFGHKPRELMG